MKKRIVLVLAGISIFVLAISTLSFAAEAGLLVFPVGNPYVAPTQSGNSNGFTITQSFNTSVLYSDNTTDGPADHGWCLLDKKEDDRYTTLKDCMNHGGAWQYGHSGSDLSNGRSGDNVVAIADGHVVEAGSYRGWGNFVLIKHIMPTGMVAYSLYGHLLDDPTSLKGRDVRVGDHIGRVGFEGTSTGPHLHVTVVNASLLSDPSKPLISQIAGYLFNDRDNKLKYYYDALLSIDDRNHSTTIPLLLSRWTYFSLPFNATSSTAYVEYQGKKYSLGRAASFHWINSQLQVYQSGSWIASSANPDRIIFNSDKQYHRIWGLVSGATLTIFQPGNHYPDSRARRDMVQASLGDGRFGAAIRETYAPVPSPSPDWEWRRMAFKFTGLSTGIYMYYSTCKANPLIRYTTYFDPATHSWTPWRQAFL